MEQAGLSAPWRAAYAKPLPPMEPRVAVVALQLVAAASTPVTGADRKDSLTQQDA